MALLEIECPNCRDKVPHDTDRKAVFCIYCGARLPTEGIQPTGRRYVLDSSTGSASNKEIDASAITITMAENIRTNVTYFIDGKRAGVLKRGQTAVLDIDFGRHELLARVGIEGAEKSVIDLVAGDRLRIEHNGLKGYSIVKF